MILLLAYLSFGFIAFQLFNTLLNFIFYQKIHKNQLEMSDKISVLIPARNEEKNIRFLLNDLQEIKNENVEIIVFDDQSTDRTAEIVTEIAEQDKRIKLLISRDLPKGWLGKNNACYQLAHQAKGDYFLFLDADVRLKDSIIKDVVFFFKKKRLSLLSVFPVQIQKTWGERLSVPIMNYILLTLLPLIFVRTSPFSSHAAANGQFMLFKASDYKKIQPHKLFKSSSVEDIAIARYYKKQKLNIACLTGENSIQCRMYNSFDQALNGFSKNVFMFFGNIPLLAFMFWIVVTIGFVPIWISTPHLLPIYFMMMGCILILYTARSKQNIVLNIVLFPLHLYFLCRVMINSLYLKKEKRYVWKERNIYS